MDPPTHPGASLISPGASRVSLPLVIGTSNSSEGISTGSTGAPSDQRREVFSDFKRFVSFGLRKDTLAP